MRAIRSGAALAAVALAVAGCGASAGSAGSADDGRISVITSTNVWGSVAKAVGGDRVRVESLINDAAADPHGYVDKPEDATKLAGADLAIYNGGGYDDFFAKLVDAAGQGAERIVAFDQSGHRDTATHEDGEPEHGEVNEHVWYDLTSVQKVADLIAKDLSEVEPANKADFEANAESFNTSLDGLIAKAAEIGAAHPGGKVVATEPVAKYLLDAAGLTDATPPDFSEAIEEETDPPVLAVADTTDLITNKQVLALVNNAQTETPVTNQLREAAAAAGVPVVDVTETLPPGVTDYVEWMTEQVTALSDALAGT